MVLGRHHLEQSKVVIVLRVILDSRKLVSPNGRLDRLAGTASRLKLSEKKKKSTAEAGARERLETLLKSCSARALALTAL